MYSGCSAACKGYLSFQKAVGRELMHATQIYGTTVACFLLVRSHIRSFMCVVIHLYNMVPRIGLYFKGNQRSFSVHCLARRWFLKNSLDILWEVLHLCARCQPSSCRVYFSVLLTTTGVHVSHRTGLNGVIY